MDFSFGAAVKAISDHEMSRLFFFDDIRDKRHFIKQFYKRHIYYHCNDRSGSGYDAEKPELQVYQGCKEKCNGYMDLCS